MKDTQILGWRQGALMSMIGEQEEQNILDYKYKLGETV